MPLLLSEAVPYQADPTHEAAVALQKRTTPLVTGWPLAVTLPVSVTVVAVVTMLAERVNVVVDCRKDVASGMAAGGNCSLDDKRAQLLRPRWLCDSQQSSADAY